MSCMWWFRIVVGGTPLFWHHINPCFQSQKASIKYFGQWSLIATLGFLSRIYLSQSMVEPPDLPLQQLQLVDRQQGGVKLNALFADLEEFPPLSDDDSSHQLPPRRPQGAWGASHSRGLVSRSPLLALPRS